ncbi:TonB-dependent receptor domain-containing protein [Chitinophaga sp. MM2321]|uniref:TonB-dependent receptor domain-containing protein n=1 Tax=Chitinophaga sp. MM2321 TaxID=3137178 RepID=UPI0032D5A29D
MKFIVAQIFILILSFQSLAQSGANYIHGSVVDSVSGDPVPGVTLQWRNEKDSVIGIGTTSDKGAFHIKCTTLPGRENTLSISFIGYRTKQLVFEVKKQATTDIGSVSIAPAFTDLQGITVTAQKESYQVMPDKKVFNVASNLNAKGGTVSEVFRQIPGVTINSGKITLRNSTPTLLLDGKRTNLTLEQIPADQVASIEIITNPSAKYDADGSGGIINIISKKNSKAGMYGSVNANWTTIPEHNLYGDFNISKGDFRFNVNFLEHGHQGKHRETLYRNNLSDGTALQQQAESVTKGPFRKGKFTLDYEPNKQHTFSLTGTYGGGDFRTYNNQQSYYLNKAALADSGAIRHTGNTENFRFGQAALSYAYQFRKQGEKLTADFSVEKYKGPVDGSYHMQYQDPQGASLGNPVLQQSSGGFKGHTVILQSDYTNTFKENKAKLETGVKITWHKDRNQSLLQDYDHHTSDYLVNKQGTYDFNYKDPTYSAYGNFSDSYGKFSYIAGLRFEQYDYTGMMPDSGIRIAYHNPGLFPSFFLTRQLGAEQELHLNYSRRVTRPAFDEITPRIDYSNPQNLFKGNTALQSAFTNLLEFSYNKSFGKSTLIATAYLRNIQHPITTYTYPIAPDTLLTTYINADHSNTYGAELIFKNPITTWWNLTTNLNFFDTRITDTHIGSVLDNSGFSWFAKLSSDAKLPQDMTLQLSASYEAPQIIPQGKTSSTSSIDLALKKDFLKEKNLALTLSCTDIFNTDRYRRITALPGTFQQDFLQKYTTRVFKINVNYRFGRANGKEIQHKKIETNYSKQ